jgi:predicted XRE-type DNA-binding protein
MTEIQITKMIKKMLRDKSQKELARELGVNQVDISNALKCSFNHKLLDAIDVKKIITYKKGG